MWKSLVIIGLTILFQSCSKDEPCSENFKKDCVCTAQYDPVCGCNGKTYGNACEAACASIEVQYTGECKK